MAKKTTDKSVRNDDVSGKAQILGDDVSSPLKKTSSRSKKKSDTAPNNSSNTVKKNTATQKKNAAAAQSENPIVEKKTNRPSQKPANAPTAKKHTKKKIAPPVISKTETPHKKVATASDNHALAPQTDVQAQVKPLSPPLKKSNRVSPKNLVGAKTKNNSAAPEQTVSSKAPQKKTVSRKKRSDIPPAIQEKQLETTASETIVIPKTIQSKPIRQKKRKSSPTKTQTIEQKQGASKPENSPTIASETGNNVDKFPSQTDSRKTAAVFLFPKKDEAKPLQPTAETPPVKTAVQEFLERITAAKKAAVENDATQNTAPANVVAPKKGKDAATAGRNNEVAAAAQTGAQQQAPETIVQKQSRNQKNKAKKQKSDVQKSAAPNVEIVETDPQTVQPSGKSLQSDNATANEPPLELQKKKKRRNRKSKNKNRNAETISATMQNSSDANSIGNASDSGAMVAAMPEGTESPMTAESQEDLSEPPLETKGKRSKWKDRREKKKQKALQERDAESLKGNTAGQETQHASPIQSEESNDQKITDVFAIVSSSAGTKPETKKQTEKEKPYTLIPLPPPEEKTKKTLRSRIVEIPRPYAINDEFCLSLINRVRASLLSDFHIQSGDKILLAVSGGVDSVAMTDIFAVLGSEMKFEVHTAHCNHHLRGKESDFDEQSVKALSKRYRMHYHRASLRVEEYSKSQHLSIETAARTLRYSALEKIAKSHSTLYIATAHTADDAAETFLLNLFRGSGLTGLSGIPIMRPVSKKISVIRPLLQLHKDEILEYAKRRQLRWREDSSNKSLLYTRNKVRLKALPILKEIFSPAVIGVLNRTAKLLHGADDVIKEITEQAALDIAKQSDNSSVTVDIAKLRAYHKFLQGEILHYILTHKFGIPSISLSATDRILRLMNSDIHAQTEFSSNYVALRDRDVLIFIKKKKINEVLEHVSIGEDAVVGDRIFRMEKISGKIKDFQDNALVEYISSEIIPSQLTLRNWRNGDKFQPLGMLGTMSVSDFLTNEKVGALERKSILVLCAGTEILWVVGKRISEKFKLSPQTKSVVRLEFLPKKDS